MPFLYTTSPMHFHTELCIRFNKHLTEMDNKPDKLAPLFFLYTSPEIQTDYATRQNWLNELKHRAYMSGYAFHMEWRHEEVHLLRDVFRFTLPTDFPAKSLLSRPSPRLKAL